MKKIIVFIFCCCLVLSNVSCQSKQLPEDGTDNGTNITNKAVECNHQWVNATCTEPKKCTLCGTTDGVALGHVWKEATCVTYKTCSVCGEKFDNNYGKHSYVNGVCSSCGKNEVEVKFTQTGSIAVSSFNGANYDYITINNVSVFVSGNSVIISGTFTITYFGAAEYGGGYITANCTLRDERGSRVYAGTLFHVYCSTKGTYSFSKTIDGLSGLYVLDISG